MSGARGQEQPHSYLWDREVLMNLVIMSYMWSACSFCYYLLLVYIKYLPGSLYENGVMMSVAEMVGAVCSGIVMKTAGLKISLISLMIVSLAGGLMISFLGESHLNWMPFFVCWQNSECQECSISTTHAHSQSFRLCLTGLR